jgi:hypothetical protein
MWVPAGVGALHFVRCIGVVLGGASGVTLRPGFCLCSVVENTLLVVAWAAGGLVCTDLSRCFMPAFVVEVLGF